MKFYYLFYGREIIFFCFQINNQSVIGLDNPAVVEILKLTTGTVKLKFHRYTKGPIYEILIQTGMEYIFFLFLPNYL